MGNDEWCIVTIFWVRKKEKHCCCCWWLTFQQPFRKSSSQSRHSIKQSVACLCTLLWLVSWNVVLFVVCQSGWDVISYEGFEQRCPIHGRVTLSIEIFRSANQNQDENEDENEFSCLLIVQKWSCPYVTLWCMPETRCRSLIDNEVISRKRHLNGHQTFKRDFVLPTHQKYSKPLLCHVCPQ